MNSQDFDIIQCNINTNHNLKRYETQYNHDCIRCSLFKIIRTQVLMNVLYCVLKYKVKIGVFYYSLLYSNSNHFI